MSTTSSATTATSSGSFGTAPTQPGFAPGTIAGRTGPLRDTGTVLLRQLRPMLRNPFEILFAMIQPLVFLALFGPLLSGTGGFGEGSTLQWFVPGIVAMSCLFGASMTGSGLLMEMQSGSHERLLVAPLNRSALLLGRALNEILPVLVQTAVIIAIVTPFSFDLHLGGVVVGMAVLALFTIGVGSLSYTLALATKGMDWIFWTVQQALLFPVLLLAGMLLPIEGAPRWLEIASSLNPLTYVVEATRGLFAGEIWTWTTLEGVLAAALVAGLGLWAGTRAMRRAS
jgi:ABC-2 type transport system permease protein